MEAKLASTWRIESIMAAGPPTTTIAVMGTTIRETSMISPWTTSV